MIERGKTYGINTELNIAEFIDLTIVFGPNLDTEEGYTEAVNLLKNKDFSGQEKN